MSVIAQIYSVSDDDPHSAVVGLRETPFPGDLISLKNGRTVRVLRRTFRELDGDDKVDVELGVRTA